VIIKITPVRIAPSISLIFQSRFHAFKSLLARYRFVDCRVRLRMNQQGKIILTAKSGSRTLPVLKDTCREIGGHANVQHAAGPVRHDVGPATPPHVGTVSQASRDASLRWHDDRGGAAAYLFPPSPQRRLGSQEAWMISPSILTLRYG
jgi:hypothetical protein